MIDAIGITMNEWPSMTLRAAGVSLIDCDHRTPAAATHGYPYIAIPQLKAGRIDLTDVRRISPTDFLSWTKKARPSTNDVILSRRCNPGETAVVPTGPECALGQNLVLLRADGQRVYPPFLRWLTRGPGWWDQVAKFLNVGAVFDSLRCSDIVNFEVAIPPLPEQRAIARILGALDDKIELNRRTNETLGAMARALFKSWFVDFDPVRAKMEGRTPAGMDAATAALFPSRLDGKDGDTIPEGWLRGPLSDMQAPTPRAITAGPFGSNLTQVDYVEDGVPVIRGSNLTGGVFAFSEENFVFVTEEKADSLSACLARPGDIVFTQRGTLGQVSMIPRQGKHRRYLLSQSQMKMSCDPARGCEEYVALHFEQPSVVEYILANGGQAGVPHINLSFLRNMRLLIPPAEITRQFRKALGPIVGRMAQCRGESRTLAALRDALLPRLLSGELRVRDAERLAERAL